MNPRHFKVEWIGIPGAGKTTISALVADELRATGQCVWDRPQHRAVVGAHHRKQSAAARTWEWLNYVRNIGRSPALAAAALARDTRPRNVAGWRRAYVFARLLHNDHLFWTLTDRQEGIVVLDQDLLQEVWGILYLRRCRHPEAVRRLLASIRSHLPQLVVSVRIPAPAALTRLRARVSTDGAGGEIDGMTDLSARVLESSGHEVDRIARLATDLAGGDLVELDGTQPAAEQAEIVLRRILKYTDRARRAAGRTQLGGA